MEHLTAIVDSREQTPWDLSPMTMETDGLSVGDYSVKGLESIVAIERKSLPDFVACCGSERERFQKELDRLRGWPVNAIVIEANWADLEQGQWRGKLTAKQVQASFCSWIAQGHRLILGRDHATAASIARGIGCGKLLESWPACQSNSVDSEYCSREVLKWLSFFFPGNVVHGERSMVC